MVNEMNPELFRVGDHIRFTDKFARKFSVSHYKGDTGGQVTVVDGHIYWLRGHVYGVYHKDVQPGDGPW